MPKIEPDKMALRIAPGVAKILFSSAAEIKLSSGRTIPIRDMAGGKCRGADLGDHRFVTQNPAKYSKWAKMAREGHKVMWIINSRTGKWLGPVVDGKINGNYKPFMKISW